MLNTLLRVSLLLALPLSATAQVCPDAVYDSNTVGFKDVGGATIGKVDGRTYGIQHLCNGTVHKLLLQVNVASPTADHPQWQTLDTLVIPVGSKRFEIIFGEDSYSRLNGDLDPELVSLARVTDKEFWNSVKVWRANRTTGKFQLLKKVRTTCENPGYGV